MSFHRLYFFYRTQLQKAKERDVSELIALGMPNPTNKAIETQFDSRLFNADQVRKIQRQSNSFKTFYY